MINNKSKLQMNTSLSSYKKTEIDQMQILKEIHEQLG